MTTPNNVLIFPRHASASDRVTTSPVTPVCMVERHALVRDLYGAKAARWVKREDLALTNEDYLRAIGGQARTA